MARYFEAPNPLPDTNNYNHRLFLAGGISNCWDWQKVVTEALIDKEGLDILNPRRLEFNLLDTGAARQQIVWEYDALHIATARLFWFTDETIQPIALFELGKWCRSFQPLFIGVHPNYARRMDIEIQIQLQRPDLTIYNTLEKTIMATKVWLETTTY